MALQRYAFEGAGYNVRKTILMHINNRYVRKGDIDSKGFFALEDCTEIVESRLPDVPSFLSVRFYGTSGNNRYQHRKASLGKTHILSISSPTSLRFGSPDIRPRSVTPARPPPRCHIVGSLFATYTGSASCFLRTPHFWKLPLPCWRGPSVR